MSNKLVSFTFDDFGNLLVAFDVSAPLPVDLVSSEVVLDATISSLSLKDDVLNNFARVTNAGNLTVDLANVSGAIPLPTGAATAANQATEIATLSSIDTDIQALKTQISLGTGTNAIGGVTQAGTWNVGLTGALPAGSNTIGGITIADGSNITFGTKTDAKNAATDGTAVSAISLLKQISYTLQNPPGGGGSAVSIANGSDVALGSTTDVGSLVTDATAATLIALTKGTSKMLQGGNNATTGGIVLGPGLNAGANIIGTILVGNASIAVTGSFWQNVQPVSGTVAANQSGAWVVAASQNGSWLVSLDSTDSGSLTSIASNTTGLATQATLLAAKADLDTLATAVNAAALNINPPASLPLPTNASKESGGNLDTIVAKWITLLLARAASSTGISGPVLMGEVLESTNSYLDGTVQPIALTTEGRVRVASYPAEVYLDFFGGDYNFGQNTGEVFNQTNPWGF